MAENKKSEAALREERVLEFWKENKIFNKSLAQTEGKKEFIFYDGPVTANSKPVLHTMVPFSFKDAIPRYKTMRGFHVRRKGGWDTHGLPVELQVEKKLGLNSKKAIEEYGIAKFNRECRESVWEYVEFWKNFTARMGYWADQDNAYVTYYNEYIESVWSVVKKINEQKLLYKDYKVVPWCPRCGTALSSHELAQGYEDVKDLSITAKFKVVGPADANAKAGKQGDTYILAWTTTPWTLPGNVALAVGEDITYVRTKVGNEIFVVAKERLTVIPEPYEILEELKGRDLVGLEYEPLFPYLKEQIEKKKESTEKMFKVYPANFVNTEDGTGIVHTAVMYGQDDFELGTGLGLPKHHLVGQDGKFLPGTGIFEGRFVKEKDEAGKPTLDVDIIKYLTDKNFFFGKENYLHSYPHCWRCKTALIYYARDSWYIKVSDPKIKSGMIAENKDINWEPSHIRDGRFGEWLREIKDWAISRERYWGTPLPVWTCGDCKKTEVLGSLEEIKARTKKSGNEYTVLRHGEADNIVLDIATSNVVKDDKYHLTENGKKEVHDSARVLGNKKFDLIIASPLIRTTETAKIAALETGYPEVDIIYDDRIREVNTGDFHNKRNGDYHNYFSGTEEKFTKNPPNGENLTELKRRVMEFLYDIESKYSGKKILIVSHEYSIWMMTTGVLGWSNKESVEEKERRGDDFIRTAGVADLNFVPLPHDDNFDLDLHKPYIDEADLVCDCGGKLTRTKEVMDVWFDSGAMPFAQDHYPFENKAWVEGPGYPADFISEAIDQTRGWFYTLHAVGVMMGRGKAFKNVICLGHLLDAKGKKMSKSVGNVVDPWEAMNKYGVDTLRLWMYSVNQPGESKNFDEKTVALLYQQVFGLLYNVLAFYELYPIPEQARYGAGRDTPKSKNVLDRWILARLDELTELSTESMDNYKLLEPTRAIRDFVGDLSTWYLRRSRERIKEGDSEAKATLYFALITLAKILAPFAPFAADDLWLKLRNDNDAVSVHLSEWPSVHSGFFSFGKSKIIPDMERARKIVTLGLEARQKAGIKVRQPLTMLEVRDFSLGKEYVELIKDEINVKDIKENKNLESEVLLDAAITPELKSEGAYRELARALQDMRKKIGLTPSDVVGITFETNDEGRELVRKFEADMKKTVLASEIEFKPARHASQGDTGGENNGEEIKVDELIFKVSIAISPK